MNQYRSPVLLHCCLVYHRIPRLILLTAKFEIIRSPVVIIDTNETNLYYIIRFIIWLITFLLQNDVEFVISFWAGCSQQTNCLHHINRIQDSIFFYLNIFYFKTIISYALYILRFFSSFAFNNIKKTRLCKQLLVFCLTKKETNMTFFSNNPSYIVLTSYHKLYYKR